MSHEYSCTLIPSFGNHSSLLGLPHDRAHLLRRRHLPLLLSADRRIRRKPLILPPKNLCRRVHRLRYLLPCPPDCRRRHRSAKRRLALEDAKRGRHNGRWLSAASRLVSLFRWLLRRFLPARSCAPRGVKSIVRYPADIAGIPSIPLLIRPRGDLHFCEINFPSCRIERRVRGQARQSRSLLHDS